MGVHYCIRTVHAHLVPVYKAVAGYWGSMAGVVVVTREKRLLDSDPPITQRKILGKFWNNGDANGH